MEKMRARLSFSSVKKEQKEEYVFRPMFTFGQNIKISVNFFFFFALILVED